MYRFFLFFFFLNNICATRYRERSVSETRPVFFFSNPPLPPPLSSQGTISLTPDASSGGIAWRTYRVSEVVEQVEKSPTVVYPNQDGRKTLYLFPFPSFFLSSFFLFFQFEPGASKTQFFFPETRTPCIIPGDTRGARPSYAWACYTDHSYRSRQYTCTGRNRCIYVCVYTRIYTYTTSKKLCDSFHGNVTLPSTEGGWEMLLERVLSYVWSSSIFRLNSFRWDEDFERIVFLSFFRRIVTRRFFSEQSFRFVGCCKEDKKKKED